MQLIKLEIRPNGIAVLVIGFCDPTYELPLLLWYTPNTGGKPLQRKAPIPLLAFFGSFSASGAGSTPLKS